MRELKVFIVAGEASGDFLGSQLMKALKEERGENLTFIGVGGHLMAEQGLKSLFPIEELSVMGLAEVIPHIWKIRRRIHEAVAAIEDNCPDVVVTIDSPGFNFRVGKLLKQRNKSIPLVHYVAPSVWAWRPGRARKVSQFLDKLLVVLPFEPPYFLKEGLKTEFVGHSIVEMGFEQGDKDFRKRFGIAENTPLLTVLPGSRRGEISRLLPVFKDTVKLLQKKYPDLQVVIPTLPHLVEQIKASFDLPCTIVTTVQDKKAAFRASQAALAASGTVSLELAAAGLPAVIAYKLNPVTYSIVKRLVKVKHASLVNILSNEEVIPECLQENCTPEKLVAEIDRLIQGKDRTKMISQMTTAIDMLRSPISNKTPSQCASGQLLEML